MPMLKRGKPCINLQPEPTWSAWIFNVPPNAASDLEGATSSAPYFSGPAPQARGRLPYPRVKSSIARDARLAGSVSRGSELLDQNLEDLEVAPSHRPTMSPQPAQDVLNCGVPGQL